MNRKQKMALYIDKYKDIPRDYDERKQYIIDKYDITGNKMQMAIDKMQNMYNNISYKTVKIVLFEEPEGAKRHRYRIITRKNYAREAMINSNFVHVYSPNASDDNNYMKRLVGQDLIDLEGLINTPCTVIINSYFKTPSTYNGIDVYLAENYMHRHISKPDWDNIGKKYSDMNNTNVWLDDALVISGVVNKFYSILPRVEIYIKYMNCVTNIHQYRQLSKRVNSHIHFLDRNGNLI